MSYMQMILEIRLLFHFKIFYSEGICINKNVKNKFTIIYMILNKNIRKCDFINEISKTILIPSL